MMYGVVKEKGIREINKSEKIEKKGKEKQKDKKIRKGTKLGVVVVSVVRKY